MVPSVRPIQEEKHRRLVRAVGVQRLVLSNSAAGMWSRFTRGSGPEVRVRKDPTVTVQVPAMMPRSDGSGDRGAFVTVVSHRPTPVLDSRHRRPADLRGWCLLRFVSGVRSTSSAPSVFEQRHAGWPKFRRFVRQRRTARMRPFVGLVRKSKELCRQVRVRRVARDPRGHTRRLPP